MEIPTRNRSDLKSYFVKNAIPTEGQFAELIDGMINQQDDGLVKLPGDPLSIEAAGDESSEKKAIRFYQHRDDDRPAWVLSLSPNRDPGRSGLSIGDGGGTSRLFIDQTTGHVGIGTTAPDDRLVVYDPSTSGDGGITIRRGRYARLSIISDNYWSGIELRRDSAGEAGRPYIDFTNDLTTNFGIRISAPTNDSLTIDGGYVGIGNGAPAYPLHVTQAFDGADWQARFTNGPSNVYLSHNGGFGIHINTGNENVTNRYGLLVRNKTQTHLFVRDDGNVGIGTDAPSHRLHVIANGGVGLLESTTNTAFLRLANKEGINNRVEITCRAGGRLSLWTAGSGDIFNILRNSCTTI